MTEASLHPTLRIPRAFDVALTRASQVRPQSDFLTGACYALIVIAEAAGMADDPRVAALGDRISEASTLPDGGRAA